MQHGQSYRNQHQLAGNASLLLALMRCLVFDQFLSGTIPACIGDLTKLEVLASARNYHTSAIPKTLNALSSLRTVMLSSNRFECNAPGLDSSTQLAQGPFQGIVYPGGQHCPVLRVSSAHVCSWLEQIVNTLTSVCAELLIGSQRRP